MKLDIWALFSDAKYAVVLLKFPSSKVHQLLHKMTLLQLPKRVKFEVKKERFIENQSNLMDLEGPICVLYESTWENFMEQMDSLAVRPRLTSAEPADDQFIEYACMPLCVRIVVYRKLNKGKVKNLILNVICLYIR